MIIKEYKKEISTWSHEKLQRELDQVYELAGLAVSDWGHVDYDRMMEKVALLKEEIKSR